MNAIMQWAKNKKGFTIVELLIVVVVIAILAAITIVAYNGIQNRAKDSAAKSAASQAAKKIATSAITNSDLYPSIATFTAETGYTASTNGSTPYQYTVSSDQRTYCLTITTGGISYYVSNASNNPTKGACSGHGLDGLPQNLAMNPSFEVSGTAFNLRTNLHTNPTFESGSTAGWGNVNGGVGVGVAPSSSQAHSGTQSLLYTYGDSTTQDSGPSSSIAATAGTTYTISAWVYSPVLVSGGLRLITYGTAIGNTFRGNSNTTVGAWTRVSHTVTAVATGALSFAIAKTFSAADTGKLVYVDSVLAEASGGLDSYFSGASSAQGDYTYAWSGTANSSISYERALAVANYITNGTGGLSRFQSAVRTTNGGYSAQVKTISSSTNPGLYQGITLDPGTYTFIAKVWLEAGVAPNVSLTMQGTGVAVNNTSGYQPLTTTQGQWVELRRQLVLSSANNVNFFVYSSGSSTTAGSSFWVDEFAVVSGDCTATVCY